MKNLIPYRRICSFFLVLMLPVCVFGQQRTADNGATTFTLKECIAYALKNQPIVNQAIIDEAVARTNNAIALSTWLPQVNGAANLQHYFQLRTAFFNSNGVLTPFRSGVINNSVPQVSATQTLFSNDVLLAMRAAKLNTLDAKQGTKAAKISIIAGVSKAFYELLLSIEQINVYREDTARLKKNQADAYHRYVSGITDKVDYKQATISLNNSLSQLKTADGMVQAKYALLKQYMGYPADRHFTVRFDTAQLMQEVYADTTARLLFDKRIEYQVLQTAKKIQHETTKYYRMGFIPSLSAYYNYIHEYQNNKFSELYNTGYPYSYAGIQLNIPLFTGFRRIENIRKAKLQEQRTDWDEVALKLAIYSEYQQALANYKSDLYNLRSQGENVQMAREVYNIVKLQYNEGIKPYLDVIVAQTGLQTSEINYLNALFNLLASKIDLEKAMGNISPDS